MNKPKTDKPKAKPKTEKPKAEVVAEPVEVQVAEKPVKWSPSVGEKCLFTNAENEFVASITSFEPLSVNMHGVRGGCQYEEELSIESLKEYTVSPLTRAEVVARLSDAGI